MGHPRWPCNGTDYRHQVAGTGDEWFYRPRPARRTACSSATTARTTPTPTSGDSAITETAGIGGFRDGDPRPSSVRRRLGARRAGHHPADARVTLGENPRWSVPVLEFQGTPTGIDVTLVYRTGITAADQHRHGPRRRRVGQVGASRDLPPAESSHAGARPRWQSLGVHRAPGRPPDVTPGRPRRGCPPRIALRAASSTSGCRAGKSARDPPPRHPAAVRGQRRPDQARPPPPGRAPCPTSASA